jgi:hypothetical protein
MTVSPSEARSDPIAPCGSSAGPGSLPPPLHDLERRRVARRRSRQPALISSTRSDLPQDLGHRRLSGPPPGIPDGPRRNPDRRGCPRTAAARRVSRGNSGPETAFVVMHDPPNARAAQRRPGAEHRARPVLRDAEPRAVSRTTLDFYRMRRTTARVWSRGDDEGTVAIARPRIAAADCRVNETSVEEDPRPAIRDPIAPAQRRSGKPAERASGRSQGRQPSLFYTSSSLFLEPGPNNCQHRAMSCLR